MTNEREGRIATSEHKRRVEAWWQARSDHEAAEILNMQYAAFSQWRRQIGLPPRVKLTEKFGIPVREAEGILNDLEGLLYTAQQLRRSCEVAARSHALPEKRPRGQY